MGGLQEAGTTHLLGDDQLARFLKIASEGGVLVKRGTAALAVAGVRPEHHDYLVDVGPYFRAV
jgi:hypothetical protein